MRREAKKMMEGNLEVLIAFAPIELSSMVKRDKDTLVPDFENSIRYHRYESHSIQNIYCFVLFDVC